MNRNYIYPILGATGLSFLLIMFFFIGNKPEQLTGQDIQVENPPFITYISGSGIVEPASGNIMITPPFTRTIEKINCLINTKVKKGDVLFELYNKDLKSNLKIKQKKYETCLSNLRRLEEVPREEDFIIAQENLNKAQAIFNQSKTEYCMAKRRAKSKGQKCIQLYKYQQAVAEFQAAQAEFKKVKMGTWAPELKMAQFECEQAKADMKAMETEIERTYIRSPIDGTILQIKIHEGETVDQSKVAVILGNIEELNLRVSIDQFNAARFHANCPAIAFKQGDLGPEFSLKFLQIEPLMIPKKYLTNELHEKVDTQIFEILYRIEKNNYPLLVGEQMDVYIYVDKKNQGNES